jgi:aryl-alcohol dehydrogenase-like predicted oxidoreductase
VMLPIPGTNSIAHFEENFEAAQLELTDEDIEALDAVG